MISRSDTWFLAYAVGTLPTLWKRTRNFGRKKQPRADEGSGWVPAGEMVPHCEADKGTPEVPFVNLEAVC